MKVETEAKAYDDINITPMLDLAYVLLVIFIIMTTASVQGIKVDLPKANAEPIGAHAANNVEPLILSVDARGRLYLNVGANPQLPLDDATALARATAALRRAPQRMVLVKGDRAVPYGRVVTAMVMLQQAGAAKLGFLTEPPPIPSRARP
jgi:biopolymer transport protein TolR